ncbi:MAG: manganese efflux pump MntP family protein [Pseudomonadota bacterium]
MDIVTLVGIAFALAMDAFAVSVAAGVSLGDVSVRHTFRLAWHFGFFQFAMPVIGWSGGLAVRSLIEKYDHWAAFALLLFVGGNMIREALQHKESESKKSDPTKGMTLVMLSIATSIDALAVGLSFSVLNIIIWGPAVVIGLVAALCTGAGLHMGKRVGASSPIGRYADMLGGLVLLTIGLKILFDHNVFSAFP